MIDENEKANAVPAKEKLHSCWFCGYDKLKYSTTKSNTRQYTEGAIRITSRVRCPRCHARGPSVSVKQSINERGFDKTAEKRVEAEMLAAKVWNNTDGKLDVKNINDDWQ